MEHFYSAFIFNISQYRISESMQTFSLCINIYIFILIFFFKLNITPNGTITLSNALGIFKYFLKYSFNNENTGVGVARELEFFKCWWPKMCLLQTCLRLLS